VSHVTLVHRFIVSLPMVVWKNIDKNNKKGEHQQQKPGGCIWGEFHCNIVPMKLFVMISVMLILHLFCDLCVKLMMMNHDNEDEEDVVVVVVVVVVSAPSNREA